jgi:two-component system, response regulator PdtaR
LTEDCGHAASVKACRLVGPRMNDAPAKPLLNVSVLVAEDDPLVAFDVMGGLLKAGAHILGPAMSAERAVELAQLETADCAVLDVMLRDGPVFPAAAILRKRRAGIVFYTGYVKPENLRQQWPGAVVLIKPVPMSVLIRSLTEVLNNKGSDS